ncbi:polyketide synthase [Colletotrichum incanum]|uniref:Polyketide synthase n=1 Tax=Colletotrichum incanum TaxID=1573173 RepID=A0A167APS5_COLIC|nr:polyketide synthase [Colletotrichum incanum]
MSQPLFLEDGLGYEIVSSLSPNPSDSQEAMEFQIRSWEEKRGWLEHCRGLIVTNETRCQSLLKSCNGHTTQVSSLDNSQGSERRISKAQLYTELIQHGWRYPESMQHPRHAFRDDKTPSAVHTEAVEALLQLSLFALNHRGNLPVAPHVPFYIQELFFNAQMLQKIDTKLIVSTETNDHLERRPLHSQVESFEPSGLGSLAITMTGLKFFPVIAAVPSSENPLRLCYKLQWEAAVSHNETGQTIHSPRHPISNDAVGILIISEWSRNNSLISSLIDALTIHFEGFIEVARFIEADPTGKISVVLFEGDELMPSTLTEPLLFQLKRTLIGSHACLWVTSGAYKSPVKPHANLCAGLLRAFRSEYEARAAILELHPSSEIGPDGQSALILSVLGRLLASENVTDMEYAEEAGQLVVPRMVENRKMNLDVSHRLRQDSIFPQHFRQPGRNLALRVGVPGQFESLYFDDQSSEPPKDDEVEIQVFASGISSSDVSSLGKRSLTHHYIGSQMSGIVSRVGAKAIRFSVGDRVCAVSERGFCTSVTCSSANTVKLPHWMDIEEAASILVPYCTGFYAVVEAASVVKGDRVIIDWVGDMSLAVIQLTNFIGAHIYVIVQSQEERDQILRMDCGISDAQIFDSRGPQFLREVRDATHGNGADVIITFSDSEQSRVSSCIADCGRLIEIRISAEENAPCEVGFTSWKDNCTFTTVNLENLARSRPKVMEKVLIRVMKLFEDGKVVANVPAVFGMSEIRQAFRQALNRRNMTPVVVVPRLGEKIQLLKTLCHSNSAHLIVGGSGGLGLCIARWMIRKGARCLVLLSRSGGRSGKVQELITEAESLGAFVVAERCYVSNEAEVQQLMADLAKALPPIRGVVHAAMVLHDIPLENMSLADYKDVLRPKVDGAWNLHNALANVELDYFLVLSSISGVIGSRGQAAYAAASTFLDSFARYRVLNSLPGTAIDLPPVLDAGYISENPHRKDAILENFGGQGLCVREVLAVMEAILADTSRGKLRDHCSIGLGQFSSSRYPLTCYMKDPRFKCLSSTAHSPLKSSADTKPLTLVTERLKDKSFVAEAKEIISMAISRKMSSMLMRPLNDIDCQKSITAYGLDSLNAIELRNWVARELSVNFQVLELLTSESIYHFSEMVVEKLAQC